MIEFNETIRWIYSRDDYNFVVTGKGECYAWGCNLFGRLGFTNAIKNQKLPLQIKALPKIRSIAMGKHHCIGIT
jgi:alpha-tubulin suppressor-like RCC1 family protein